MEKYNLSIQFKWLKDTKKLADEKLIEEDMANHIIDSHMHLFTSLEEKINVILRGDIVEHIYQREYWAKKLIDFNTENTIKVLEDAMQRQYTSELIIEATKSFLKLDFQTRADFYNRNFAIDSENEGKIKMCGTTKKTWLKGIHHNLPTLLNFIKDKEYIDLPKSVLESLIVEVENDINTTLKTEEEKELFLPGKIVFANFKKTHEYWNEWKIDSNTFHQNLVAIKFFSKGSFDSSVFISQIKNENIPLDLKFNKTYFMTIYIKKICSTAFFKLKNHSISRDDEETLKSNLESLESLNKYDLSFINLKEIAESFKEQMSKNSFKETHPSHRKWYLNFLLTIENMSKSKKEEIKKFKI